MSLVVLCAGGHARVVIEALRSRGTRPMQIMSQRRAHAHERLVIERKLARDTSNSIRAKKLSCQINS